MAIWLQDLLAALEPLELDHVVVMTARVHQLLVGADLGDGSAIKHEDAVGMANRAQAVGDDKRGAAVEQSGQALLDQPFALGVEVTGGLVEDEDARVGQDGPGDGQPLALAAAESHAALADQGLVPVGQTLDELGGICGVRGQGDPRSGCPAIAIGDVLGNRAVEEEDILLDDAQQPAIALDLDIAQAGSIKADRSRGGIVEARDEIARASSCLSRCGPPGRSSRRARRPGRCRSAPGRLVPG